MPKSLASGKNPDARLLYIVDPLGDRWVRRTLTAKVGDAKRREALRSWVDGDLRRRFVGRILTFDYEAACRWGVITGEAEKAGTPLPVIDAQLAATALVHGLTLVTRNTSDVAASHVPVLNPWELQ